MQWKETKMEHLLMELAQVVVHQTHVVHLTTVLKAVHIGMLIQR